MSVYGREPGYPLTRQVRLVQPLRDDGLRLLLADPLHDRLRNDSGVCAVDQEQLFQLVSELRGAYVVAPLGSRGRVSCDPGVAISSRLESRATLSGTTKE